MATTCVRLLRAQDTHLHWMTFHSKRLRFAWIIKLSGISTSIQASSRSLRHLMVTSSKKVASSCSSHMKQERELQCPKIQSRLQRWGCWLKPLTASWVYIGQWFYLEDKMMQRLTRLPRKLFPSLKSFALALKVNSYSELTILPYLTSMLHPYSSFSPNSMTQFTKTPSTDWTCTTRESTSSSMWRNGKLTRRYAPTDSDTPSIKPTLSDHAAGTPQLSASFPWKYLKEIWTTESPLCQITRLGPHSKVLVMVTSIIVLFSLNIF